MDRRERLNTDSVCVCVCVCVWRVSVRRHRQFLGFLCSTSLPENTHDTHVRKQKHTLKPTFVLFPVFRSLENGGGLQSRSYSLNIMKNIGEENADTGEG